MCNYHKPSACYRGRNILLFIIYHIVQPQHPDRQLHVFPGIGIIQVAQQSFQNFINPVYQRIPVDEKLVRRFHQRTLITQIRPQRLDTFAPVRLSFFPQIIDIHLAGIPGQFHIPDAEYIIHRIIIKMIKIR